jgi:hypothetical protein
MALFYLIRHGHPDYTPCDERGYITMVGIWLPYQKEEFRKQNQLQRIQDS